MCVGGPDLKFVDTLKMSLNFCLSLTRVNLSVDLGIVINRIKVLQLSDPLLHRSQLGFKSLDLFFHAICLH